METKEVTVHVDVQEVDMQEIIKELQQFGERGREVAFLSVRVPPTAVKALDELAKGRGTNKSDLVRTAIIEYLQRHQ